MVGSLIADFNYCVKQVFSSKELFAGCLIVFGVRGAVTIFAIVKSLCCRVCNKEANNLREIDYIDEANGDA